jgi:ADP-dependent NAD(P)H-hydrate dehydratase
VSRRPESERAERVLTPQLLRGWPLPDASGGKEARGTVLVAGGSRHTPGAVLLAGVAATIAMVQLGRR